MQASTIQQMHSDSTQGNSACSACMFYKLNLCAAVGKKVKSADFHPGVPPLKSSAHTIPPRRMIHHPKDWSEFVVVTCKGWALSSISLPDGRRQILSILLPGDIIFSAGLFEPISGYSAEAISEVAYRKFNRAEFLELLFKYRDLFEMLAKIWSEDRLQADQLALDLGRRTATERIARLILNLAKRLTERNMMSEQTMEFPFRQRHIGDAVGLTPVHVSKVLAEFQRIGAIEISNRFLKITDAAELHQIAGLR